MEWTDQKTIDATCDRFELAIRGGESPSIESFLSGLSSEVRADLLAELVALEAIYRRDAGERVASDEYCARFSADIGVIKRTFELLDQDAKPSESTRGANQGATALSKGSPSPPDSPVPIEIAVGSEFGGYTILDEVGVGGMGIVYRALHRESDRQVALKLIRADRLVEANAESREELLQRFRQEASAAARLEHDNIVPVYDVGDHAGRLYFSMRLVQGHTAAALIQDGPIKPRDAAQMMVSVARAVAHAHRRGVLHRDLKPSNILIHNEGRPFVADFGMAKWLGSPDQLTRTRAGMGTPAYSSPEQVSNSSTVTELSDVYSLGATLYALITGRPPFQAAEPVATLRQVLDFDPIPPRRLLPDIPQDLETICLRALEKPSHSRFQTADEMADELQRFVDNKPIFSRPISWVRRGWRWCQRNRLPAALAAALVISLLAGGALAGVQWRRSVLHARQAEQQAEISRKNLLAAVRSVNDYFTVISEEELLNQSGMQPLRRKLLEHAKAYYEELIKGNDPDPELQFERAMAQYRLGRILVLVGSIDETAKAFEEAASAFSEFLEQHPDHEEARFLQARSIGNQATFLKRQGELDQAVALDHRAIELQAALVERTGSAEHISFLARMTNNLGQVLIERGDLAGARDCFERAVAIFDTNYSTSAMPDDAIIALTNFRLGLGEVHRQMGDIDLEAAAYRANVADLEPLVEQEPDNLYFMNRLAYSHTALGACLKRADQLEESEAAHSRAIELFRSLHTNNPSVVRYELDLAKALNLHGHLKFDQGQLDQALAKSAEGHAILLRVIETQPYARQLAEKLGRSYILQGEINSAAGNTSEARSDFQEALAQAEHLEQRSGRSWDIVVLRSAALLGIAETLVKEGDLESAIPVAGRAVETIVGLDDATARQPLNVYLRVAIFELAGRLAERERNTRAAAEYYQRALASQDECEGQPTADTQELTRKVERRLLELRASE